jgi:quinol monooxygenase YgiN
MVLTLEMLMPIEDGRKAEFIDLLRGWLERVRAREGCLECRLFEEVGKAGHLRLVQEWRDERALEDHVSGELFRTLLIAMDLLDGDPEFVIRSIDSQRKIDGIRQLYLEINGSKQ